MASVSFISSQKIFGFIISPFYLDPVTLASFDLMNVKVLQNVNSILLKQFEKS